VTFTRNLRDFYQESTRFLTILPTTKKTGKNVVDRNAFFASEWVAGRDMRTGKDVCDRVRLLVITGLLLASMRKGPTSSRGWGYSVVPLIQQGHRR
jgi:hypothetical protein